MRALAADVGGTHVRLALVDLEDRRPRILDLRETPSRRHDGVIPLLQAYLEELDGEVDRVRLAVAGPVEGDRVDLTNLDWVLDRREISRAVGVPDTLLLNDFAAVARALPLLEEPDWEVLQEGTRTGRTGIDGPAALLGAGTGLGEAFLLPGRGGAPPRVVASEGGHVDFAPRSRLEQALLEHLWSGRDHVSYERILSGSGLESIYRFLLIREGGELDGEMEEALAEGEGAARISRRALDGDEDPVADRALDLFVSVYGAQAGNLALVVRADAGVWLSGGIAPKILPRLRGSAFREAFRAKGRFRGYLESLPVRVVTETRAGILGAAAWQEAAGKR